MPSNDRPHPRPRFARADAQGAFELMAPAGKPLVLVACPAARDEDAPGRAPLAAGAADAAADVFLRRGAVLTGSVRKGAEVPVGAQVMAWPEKPQEDLGYLLNVIGLRTASPDVDGSYRLGGLVPGEYQLSVYCQGDAAKDRRTLSEGDAARWDVDFAAGHALRVKIEPAAPSGAAGLPLWAVKLFRVGPDGAREFVSFQVATPDGRADFSGLTAVEYEVVVGVSGGGRDLAVGETGPVVPGASECIVRVREERMPSSWLRGRLVDADGPRPNEIVRAQSRGSAHASWCTTTTDADGRFAFGPIVAGDWSVELGERSGPTIAAVPLLARGETRDLGDVRGR
jgi:hypothetical protein